MEAEDKLEQGKKATVFEVIDGKIHLKIISDILQYIFWKMVWREMNE